MNARALYTDVRFGFRHRFVRAAAAIAVAAWVATVTIALLYWRPHVADVRAAESEISRLVRAVGNAKHAAHVADAYRLALLQADTIDAKLTAGGGQAALVHRLARLAQQHRVKIISESYEEGRPRDDVTPLWLDLNVQARYRSLQEFFAALPTLPTWTTIQEATLARAEGGDVKAQLRLVTYRKTHGR